LSEKNTKIAPNVKPIETGIKAKAPNCASEISIAGANKDQKEAAVITPPAKPRLASKIVVPRCLSDGSTKTEKVLI
jgi:hypothetical protein